MQDAFQARDIDRVQRCFRHRHIRGRRWNRGILVNNYCLEYVTISDSKQTSVTLTTNKWT